MLSWLVCPTVSMVTTSHATGLEKTLLSEVQRLLTSSEVVKFLLKANIDAIVVIKC